MDRFLHPPDGVFAAVKVIEFSKCCFECILCYVTSIIPISHKTIGVRAQGFKMFSVKLGEKHILLAAQLIAPLSSPNTYFSEES